MSSSPDECVVGTQARASAKTERKKEPPRSSIFRDLTRTAGKAWNRVVRSVKSAFGPPIPFTVTVRGNVVNRRLMQYIKQSGDADEWPRCYEGALHDKFAVTPDWLERDFEITLFRGTTKPDKVCPVLDIVAHGKVRIHGVARYFDSRGGPRTFKLLNGETIILSGSDYTLKRHHPVRASSGKDTTRQLGQRCTTEHHFACTVALFRSYKVDLTPGEKELVQKGAKWERIEDSDLTKTEKDRYRSILEWYEDHLDNFFYDLSAQSAYAPWILSALRQCFARCTTSRTLPGYVMEIVTGVDLRTARLFPELEDAWGTLAEGTIFYDPKTGVLLKSPKHYVCELNSEDLKRVARLLFLRTCKQKERNLDGSQTPEIIVREGNWKIPIVREYLQKKWSTHLKEGIYMVPWKDFLKRVTLKGYYGPWYDDGISVATKGLFKADL